MYKADREWWIDGSVSEAVAPEDPRAVYPLLKPGESISDELAERYGLTRKAYEAPATEEAAAFSTSLPEPEAEPKPKRVRTPRARKSKTA